MTSGAGLRRRSPPRRSAQLAAELESRMLPDRIGPETPVLTPKERRCVAAALESRTLVVAAASLCIHERTLRRVLARPHVRAAIEAESSRIYSEAVDALRAAAGVLVELLDAARPALRIAAAGALLRHAAPKGAPSPSVAVAVANDSSLDVALRALPDDAKRALRAELLRRAGLDQPAHCL